MNKYFYILILSIVCCREDGKVNRSAHNISEKQIDIIFEKAKDFPDKTQISIGIIKNGVISFYGIKHEDDSILSINNQKSVFEIGSITKVLTSTILANFVLDKKVQLDNKINDYLDVELKDDVEISFKQLANHTSGLPRMPTNFNQELLYTENPYQHYNVEKLESYLSEELELSNYSGTRHEYSNLGVGLLGYVLGKIDNASYEEMLQQYIFSKYKMHSSTTKKSKLDKILVKGLDESGNEIPNWDLLALEGAGAVVSSVEDLGKFVLAQFDDTNKELELTRTKTLTINHISDYGLGWDINNRKSGEIWHRHTGRTGGYSSKMMINTSKKNGIIILSNVSYYNNNSSNLDDLYWELMYTLE